MEGAEDFVVEELPAYLPCGEGEHAFALVEKRGLTTPQAVERITRALGISVEGAGYAGLKDKEGITRQWISFHGARPEDLLAIEPAPDLKILEVSLHRNKLRTGHLRGNRFTIHLHDVAPEGREHAARVLGRLVAEGLPNYYGEQRFGRRGDNAVQGRQILRGEVSLPRDRFKRKFLLSALQSQLFNEVLARRFSPSGPGLRSLMGGEVLQRLDSGGLFVSEDREIDQGRMDRGELVITGPLYGPRMVWPKEGSTSRSVEEQVLSEAGLTLEAFSAAGRLARGGRRPLVVPVADASVTSPLTGEGILLRFALPSGSYATVLLKEITKAPLSR